jgi:hypothetical protein
MRGKAVLTVMLLLLQIRLMEATIVDREIRDPRNPIKGRSD